MPRTKGDGKGTQGGAKGRTKGSKNTISADTRQMIKLFVEDKFDEVKKEWSKLEGVSKVKTWVELTKFVLPALSAVDLSGSLVQKSVNDELKALREEE